MPRIPAWAIAVIAGVVLIAGGALIGSRLIGRGTTETVAAEGDLFEVQVTSGTVYVGRFISDRDGYIRLGRAALIAARQSASAAPQYAVQGLGIEPHNLAGDILIGREQVVIAGPVQNGSALERAYHDALGGVAPSAAP
jgi:hypothetical protein